MARTGRGTLCRTVLSQHNCPEAKLRVGKQRTGRVPERGCVSADLTQLPPGPLDQAALRGSASCGSHNLEAVLPHPVCAGEGLGRGVKPPSSKGHASACWGYVYHSWIRMNLSVVPGGF